MGIVQTQLRNLEQNFKQTTLKTSSYSSIRKAYAFPPVQQCLSCLVTNRQSTKQILCISNGRGYKVKIFYYFRKFLVHFTSDCLQNDHKHAIDSNMKDLIISPDVFQIQSRLSL